ncbi:MAG TPA: acetyl-CoA carboxylase biotin carboxyl carrier protein subunit [Polyangia bacterium]|nr:acetyl-CoA carboxylase biotin carboxyl carrier protein subunit [Polyangia bacterium]
MVDLAGERVRVDGAELDLSVEQGGTGIWVLRDGIEQTVAQVDGTAPKLTVEIRRPGADPVLVAAEVAELARAEGAATAVEATGPATLRSPIPGRVAKLLAKPGDKVAAGQTLIVLEAMKMENELRAPRAGTLSELRCAEGAPVEAGQDLATIV